MVPFAFAEDSVYIPYYVQRCCFYYSFSDVCTGVCTYSLFFISVLWYFLLPLDSFFDALFSGGGLDPVYARGGAAETDHRDAQGDAGSVGGAHVGFPQHRHQGMCVRYETCVPYLSYSGI